MSESHFCKNFLCSNHAVDNMMFPCSNAVSKIRTAHQLEGAAPVSLLGGLAGIHVQLAHSLVPFFVCCWVAVQYLEVAQAPLVDRGPDFVQAAARQDASGLQHSEGATFG
eukprot:scaffold404919_cov47-Prasinocladus_malaysianus.AAC.1